MNKNYVRQHIVSQNFPMNHSKIYIYFRPFKETIYFSFHYCT